MSVRKGLQTLIRCEADVTHSAGTTHHQSASLACEMAMAQPIQALASVCNNELLQEVERLRREVALLEQQHGDSQEDMVDEDGYSKFIRTPFLFHFVFNLANYTGFSIFSAFAIVLMIHDLGAGLSTSTRIQSWTIYPCLSSHSIIQMATDMRYNSRSTSLATCQCWHTL